MGHPKMRDPKMPQKSVLASFFHALQKIHVTPTVLGNVAIFTSENVKRLSRLKKTIVDTRF